VQLEQTTMKINRIFFLFLVFLIETSQVNANVLFNVRDFGAVGDGKVICTVSIQKAVNACAKAGGGKVIFPAGKYLSGPIFLKSNVYIEVIAGATILYIPDLQKTPVINGIWEGIERKIYASLFTGFNLENVTISGRGKLDGQGQDWWDASRETEALRKKMNLTEREPDNPKGSALKYPRPRMINLYHCKNVMISELTITNSPSWTIHPVYCKNVMIVKISIIQPYDSPNTDGIDIESCNNVRIFNCFIDCGDDCIALKSGYNEHGRKKGISCKNIVIASCTFAHGRSAICIGSEMSAGVRNVTATNCTFDGTLRGLRIKTTRNRGGVVENIIFSNIIMDNITEGISFDMYYDANSEEPKPITEKTPFFKNIRCFNIIGTNIKQAINLSGLPEAPMEDVTFQNIYFKSIEGVNCKFGKNINFNNCEINVEKGSVFLVKKTNGILLDNVGCNQPLLGIPVINIGSSSDVVVRNCKPAKGTEIFIQSWNTDDIESINNILGKAAIIKKK
jgi:polygalacturonase